MAAATAGVRSSCAGPALRATPVQGESPPPGRLGPPLLLHRGPETRDRPRTGREAAAVPPWAPPGRASPLSSASGASEQPPDKRTPEEGQGGAQVVVVVRGGNQDALSNPPLPSQAVPRGGKRPPAAARARTQLCRGVGKGRDQAAEEDCACAPGPARAAASGYARRVLPGRERGRGSTRAAAGEPGLLELARGCRKVFPKPSKSGGKRTGTKGRAEERLQPSLVKIIASLLLEAKAAGKPSVR